MRPLLLLLLACAGTTTMLAQSPITPFERSGKKETATYPECIAFYKQLDQLSPKVTIKAFGSSDAGYPLNLVLYSNDGIATPATWHKQEKIVILINNGIHPGEPDGIDASMILLRDIIQGKVKVPDNVAIGIIPLYNIGGALNRNSFSRVNQNGPLSYGFRGNAQNLDLNRDFTKSDSRNAKAFAQIFHYLDPHILIDNHVSDGADYQHTMTLLFTQHNKLGGALGTFLHDTYGPDLFKDMAAQNDDMVPYVDFEAGNPDKGWEAFYDAPRYSSGYAALFQTIAFMPETHMLKPFANRVQSTYRLMTIMLTEAGKHQQQLLTSRAADRTAVAKQQSFPLSFSADSTKFETITFKGYTADHKTSEVSGLPTLYYDHTRPFEKQVRFYNFFTGNNPVTKPTAYIIPQGWHNVTDLLLLNGVKTTRLRKDTTIQVVAYHIDDYKASPRAYEKHHKNGSVKVTATTQSIHFLKGDFIVPMGQPTDRYVVEMLEPTGDDSFFSWNFFDAILQQKEGYSDYRWEDLAAKYLREHPELKEKLEAKRKIDPTFAASGPAQLDFVYKNSPYYEPAHLRYPVYRLENN